jgi:hypothetical protein
MILLIKYELGEYALGARQETVSTLHVIDHEKYVKHVIAVCETWSKRKACWRALTAQEPAMLTKTAANEARTDDFAEVSEIRRVSEIQAALYEESLGPVACEPAYSVVDPLEGDALSTSSRRRSEYPCAFDAIAFVEGSRVLTITWLPPAPTE